MRLDVDARGFGIRAIVFAAAVCLMVAPLKAQTQTPAPAEQTQSPTPAPATSRLPDGQIEQLVAPIALYPDSLLSQVLMASTYPLEVVEAARWSKANPSVNGKALEDAMQQQK